VASRQPAGSGRNTACFACDGGWLFGVIMMVREHGSSCRGCRAGRHAREEGAVPHSKGAGSSSCAAFGLYLLGA